MEYAKISGQKLRALRDGMGLTRQNFVSEMQPNFDFPRAKAELQLYLWETGRQLPSQDYAQATFSMLQARGIDNATIEDLTESLRQDRLRKKEENLSAMFGGISILDSGHLSHVIANEYQTLLDPQLSFASQLRTTENLLIYLRCCPELVPLEWQESIITHFLGLRVESVNHINQQVLFGDGLNANQLTHYYDPPLMPQVSLLAPFKPLEAGHVDFQSLPEPTKGIGYRVLSEGLENGDWAQKTEFAFLLRHFDDFVAESNRGKLGEQFLELFGAAEAQKNPWLAWPCLKGAMKFTAPNSPLYDALIQRAKRHPSELIRIGVNLLTPNRHLNDVLEDITDFILKSADPLAHNEHVFVYYLYELCVLLPQFVQQTKTPLSRHLLSSIAAGVASHPDWRVAPQVEKTLHTIVSPYLKGD
jgi:hypothetical protein